MSGIELQVNGERRSVAEGTTAAQLLEQLSIQPERVVVEVNLAILKRAQLPSTVLKDQDRIEIVHFVGGGSSLTGRTHALVSNQLVSSRVLLPTSRRADEPNVASLLLRWQKT